MEQEKVRWSRFCSTDVFHHPCGNRLPFSCSSPSPLVSSADWAGKRAPAWKPKSQGAPTRQWTEPASQLHATFPGINPQRPSPAGEETGDGRRRGTEGEKRGQTGHSLISVSRQTAQTFYLSIPFLSQFLELREEQVCTTPQAHSSVPAVFLSAALNRFAKSRSYGMISLHNTPWPLVRSAEMKLDLSPLEDRRLFARNVSTKLTKRPPL